MIKCLSAVFLTISFVFLFCFGAAAQDNKAASYRSEAVNKIKVAKEIMNRANALVKVKPTPENLKTAMQLYAESGRLYQEGGSLLKYLGPNNASQKDIEGCDLAAKTCLEAINKIKALLQSTQMKNNK